MYKKHKINKWKLKLKKANTIAEIENRGKNT